MQPILEINLNSKNIRSIEISENWTREYLGGSALAARILFSELKKELDPLSPEAPLLFLTGPLTGTVGPAVGRFVVCGKSPATHLWAESNCGGFWGVELRKTGYDGLLIRGQAEHPIYILFNNGEVEFKDAQPFWGMDTYTTQKAILADIGNPNYRVAVIGPAGEKQIPYSMILTDHGRVAGRTGLGAILGAKKIKAIAVKGDKPIPVANAKDYEKLRAEINRTLRSDNQTQVLRELGTAGAADYFDYIGLMPKKYFHQSVFDGARNVSGAQIAETILSGVSACHGCVIACGRVVKLDDQQKHKGPEYETLVGFGPNLLIDDPKTITLLGEMCDRFGLDTISTSNTIGLAYHLYHLGKLSLKETDNIKLEWGDPNPVKILIEKIVKRDGFGEILARGAKSLAETFDAEGEAVQVNGLEVPYHDPRGGSGMALVYVTSPRGACHNQSDYFFVEIGQTDESLGIKAYPRQGGAEKAPNVAKHQNWRTIFNSLVMCIFANVSAIDITKLVEAATGYEFGIDGLLTIGERAWNLKRMINLNLGIGSGFEDLPKAFQIPYSDASGELENFVPDINTMLKSYYQARGWSVDTGIPTDEKLEELNLSWTRLAD
ncbi:MAG: aldehyde ferredoxin oxidoreductase family protein [Anaerolineales bacterium]